METTKTYLLDEAIQFLNQKISGRTWHDQFAGQQELRENYNAIILYPANHFNEVMDQVIIAFKAEGWDCKWDMAYDGRGPHHCFYVNKKHFK